MVSAKYLKKIAHNDKAAKLDYMPRYKGRCVIDQIRMTRNRQVRVLVAMIGLHWVVCCHLKCLMTSQTMCDQSKVKIVVTVGQSVQTCGQW